MITGTLRPGPKQLALWVAVCFAPAAGFAQSLAEAASTDKPVDEVVVWSQGKQSQHRSSPSSLVTPDDLQSINIVTTEDLLKHEPNLVIRRRFIGDANGTMGIRGSNMFQTSRSMVFADGVPLHYFLQSRWNGAPRWTMVSASEIAQAQVLYGPFSARYSGNSMGGVVIIETAIPQQREFHFDSTYFSQSFDAYGFSDRLSGHKTFFSYGDKFDDLSVYFSYNRLQNHSQPQNFFFGDTTSTGAAQAVEGAILDRDAFGEWQYFYGDSGPVETRNDNLKLKLGYDFDSWSTLLNIAYEDLDTITDSPNSYLRNTLGQSVWSGAVSQDGVAFSVPGHRLNVNETERRSLSLGLRLRGQLSETLELEANLNRFDILHDEMRSSRLNPADPDYDLSGQITDQDDSGWRSVEVAITASDWLLRNSEWVTGFRHENYRLSLDVYDSDNYRRGQKTAYSNRSGGETTLDAVFTELNWDFHPAMSMTLGLRYERWRSHDGYFTSGSASNLELVELPSREESQFSPKFSLSYQPASQWLLRYSLAKAYRFPIVEELFSQYSAFNAISEANPTLKPENGLHHNLMLQRLIAVGDWQVNIFAESIEDVIESQSTILPGGSLRTFIPVDEVRTRGIEFSANIFDWLPKTDLRFNMAYTRAEIAKNSTDTSIEGNTFPRMPRWRGNLMATHHINDRWDVGGSIQYASKSYDQLDNSDRQRNVFGAQDAYTRIGLKTTFRSSESTRVSVGVDNLSNDIDYVAHPWPGRTYYVNFSFDH